MWLKLPAEGQLNLLYGLLDKSTGKAGEDRRELMARGYEPYVIDVDKIPKVEAKAPGQLTEAITKVVKENEVKKKSPKEK